MFSSTEMNGSFVSTYISLYVDANYLWPTCHYLFSKLDIDYVIVIQVQVFHECARN